MEDVEHLGSLLGIDKKLLQAKDFNGSLDFAVLAQETDPLLNGPEQINNHKNLELIKKHYCCLAFLLHPDKNRFTFVDAAFCLVTEALGCSPNRLRS
ncbi:hypothetical protein Vadar_034223 [Vaccinium darrowii]|uniref:Uncharacterized protein n=1 Tax=Vaccinium darrowii TaxID=229202 RepID=A0ACB7Z9D3_9ERIC|nr:hypothetical protein Vadar_034223 [Vaccinium darrowii]